LTGDMQKLCSNIHCHNISCDFLTHRLTFFLNSSLLSLHCFWSYTVQQLLEKKRRINQISRKQKKKKLHDPRDPVMTRLMQDTEASHVRAWMVAIRCIQLDVMRYVITQLNIFQSLQRSGQMWQVYIDCSMRLGNSSNTIVKFLKCLKYLF
jgi:hypothetical protein